MRYEVLFQNPSGDTATEPITCTTHAQAIKWGGEFAETITRLNKEHPDRSDGNKKSALDLGAVKCIGASPETDCPQITPNQIYALPGKPVEWIGTVVMNAVKFVNEANIGTNLDEFGYDEEKVAAHGRLKIEKKVDIYHDGERSTSLYVIVFDEVNVGFYVGSGRGERDYTEAHVTNLPKLLELVSYLVSMFTDLHYQAPTITGLDEKIPNLRDFLERYGVEL